MLMPDRLAGPAAPRVIIRPKTAFSLGDSLCEVFGNMGLAWTLALREIQIRYKQSFIGVAWAVVQPLVTTLIFTLVFGRLANIPGDGAPYPVFVLSGLLFWQYFSRVVLEGAASLVRNEAIITKVFFPRLVLPLVPALAAAVELGISLVILMGMMAWYGLAPPVAALLLPVLLLLAGMLGFGLGLILSPLNAIYRDVGIALPFFVQIGMYVSPVIYPVSFVPERFHWVFALNPVATILDGARCLILGTAFPSPLAVTALLLWVGVVFAGGCRVFRWLEPAIVDRI